MLNRTLTEHASGCFYGSEQLAVRLWGTLLQPQLRIDQGRLQFLQDDCYQQLVNVVDTRYPRRYRLNDIRRLMDRLCDARLFLSPDLPWLDVLFHQLMLRNGDLVCYRDTEVQAYVRLAAELDPTLLVAWHLKWLATGKPATNARGYMPCGVCSNTILCTTTQSGLVFC